MGGLNQYIVARLDDILHFGQKICLGFKPVCFHGAVRGSAFH